jgi:hypothetical protein
MVTKTRKPKKGTIVPYQGDQLEIDLVSVTEPGENFDFTPYSQSELIGSGADDLESSAIRRAFGRKAEDPTWGPVHEAAVVPEQDNPEYIYTQRIYIGEPLLPFDYAPMNHRGLRGGCMGRDLSGHYIGPKFETRKGKRTIVHRASPLAGPHPFPFAKSTAAKLKEGRVKEINDWVKQWRYWWYEEGKFLPEVESELRYILDELTRWKGLTLLHWCRSITLKSKAEEQLLCPSTTIIEAIEQMQEEEF